jgi:acetyl-CoA synthetase
MKITDYKTYAEAKANFTWDQVWEFFDGDREHINIAHECIDRHPADTIALRLLFYNDGRRETYTFGELARLTSQFAYALEKLGIGKGDRVCVTLDPCLEYYVALFGTIKRGAIVVPCFTGFGKDGLAYRLKDSGSKLLVTNEEKAGLMEGEDIAHVITIGEEFKKFIAGYPEAYPCRDNCSGNDVAVYQYTSGTTRKYPEAVKQYHKSVPVGLPATLFNVGLRKDDKYFCPSSPAWGHGLWYGTFAPLAVGTATGTGSGRFSEKAFLQGLQDFEINNIGAPPTVFRQVKNSGIVKDYKLKLNKISYTGEPMDSDTFEFIEEAFGVAPCGGYGSTETGPIVMDFQGFDDYHVIKGALGKPMIGVNVGIIDDKGNQVPPGTLGEIAIMRKDGWFRVKDGAIEDENGYYWHKGRVDDVIISAGWTISPNEIEDKLQKHKNVLEAAVVGKPDKDRGHVVKAFVRINCKPSDALKKELQEFVKGELSKHEFPREIDFVDSLPKTEGGKISRREIKQWVLEETNSKQPK